MKATKVILQLVFILVFFTTRKALGEKDCHGQKILVMTKCMDTIKLRGDYLDPTAACRRAVRKSDMVCICGIITAEDELKIDVHKFIWLASDCNKQVPCGIKCGSKKLYFFWFYTTVMFLLRES